MNMKIKILKKIRREADRKVSFKREVVKVESGTEFICYTVRWEKYRAKRFFPYKDRMARDNALKFYETKRRDMIEYLMWYYHKREPLFPRP